MAITLNGTTGITTPDITSTAGFDSADLTGDIAAARITDALNATGSAPIYAARAWVNFNGTGTVAIRASGNVSSITDNGTGYFTVNFASALPDASYAYNVGLCPDYSGGYFMASAQLNNTNSGKTEIAPTTTGFSFVTLDNGFTGYRDPKYVNVAIFR